MQTFLRIKQAEQARREAYLERNGKGNELRELRQIVRASNFRKPTSRGGISAQSLASLETSVVNDAAQLLALLQIGPAKGNALRKAGFDPFAAAVAYSQGVPTLVDLAVLADAVVIGRPVDVKFEEVGDGLGSTVDLSVNEVLAGSTGRAGTVQIRQLTNATESFSFEISPGDKAQYLLFPSEGQYRNFALFKGREPKGSGGGRVAYMTPLSGYFQVVDGKVTSVLPSTTPPMALSEFRNRISALASFRRDNKLDLPQ